MTSAVIQFVLNFTPSPLSRWKQIFNIMNTPTENGRLYVLPSKLRRQSARPK